MDNEQTRADCLIVWTIGHSSRTIDDFLNCLHPYDIQVIADVRRHAGSRKHPQFNPDPFRISLAASGIDYVQFPELGGRRQGMVASRNTAWRNASFRAYSDYMETISFQKSIARLLALARTQRTAIMCSEALWWRCHRGLIADYLTLLGIRIVHIINPTRSAPHPMTSAARVIAGQLSYTEDGHHTIPMPNLSPALYRKT